MVSKQYMCLATLRRYLEGRTVRGFCLRPSSGRLIQVTQREMGFDLCWVCRACLAEDALCLREILIPEVNRPEE